MQEFKQAEEQKYDSIASERAGLYDRREYLESLLQLYEKYEPYIKYHKEQWALRGLPRKLYERKHIPELAYYDEYRNQLKDMITEPDKKINSKAWRTELASIDEKLEQTKQPYSQTVIRLATVEVLEHNKKDLERLLHNERSAKEKAQEQNRTHKRNNQSLD